MEKYYLAIDIGASSGRHILGHMEHGRMVIEEIHRFHNGLIQREQESCWDLVTLFEEIKMGMKKCKEAGKIPVSMGIDTWGVDFVLLDEIGGVIGNTVGYRDKRTEGMDEEVYKIISEQQLYERSGIQKQIYNTIYQLMAIKQRNPKQLQQADAMLMIPDYFHYLLTGVKVQEYTNATTGQLVSPQTKDWDWELIDLLGYPRNIFQPIKPAGEVLGTLSKGIEEEVGFSCKVILPATHDTGSAVLAVPSNEEHTLYISSGTWSLMGVERKEADCSELSKQRNFTNEGGYDYRFRYLKNIMGLWMIQSLKKELEDSHSFAELCASAETVEIPSIVDCNDARFLAPDSMIEAVQQYCAQSEQQVPNEVAELSCVIYKSLASYYKKTLDEIEDMTGVSYSCLHIVGGGANAEYLNELTAKATKKKVCAGPVEATAIGNLMVQMMEEKEFLTLQEARNCVFESFEVSTYECININKEI